MLIVSVYILNIDYSPITWPEGNIEYLLHLTDQTYKEKLQLVFTNVLGVVSEAHATLSL